MSALDEGFDSVRLQPILEDPPRDLNGAPAIYLDFLPSSRTEPPRIVFRLRLVNETDGELVIEANPYVATTYSLSDDEGWPVQPATPAHPVKIDAPGDDWRADRLRYLPLLGAQVDGHDLDQDAVLTGSRFPLPARATLAFDLAVDTKADRDDEEIEGPLVPGTYDLSVLVPVTFSAGGAAVDAIFSSGDVTVTVGSP